ncbi:hypothetical protein D9611_002935 [Ephemerocybe angulata]|uniref:Uncharacterized protein n=2 Tax=Ephemerocybe angulata TaxID=980116 RepID=A0A8H6H799_9AGAR|nr:hypothetical protein D9611_002935 [Tulosesus angulatus]KAF6741749.1 hypothetical protein DFP72DRAFT_228800 [Tulosesus angulatus]
MDPHEPRSSAKAPFQSATKNLSEDQVVLLLNQLLKTICLPIPIVSPTDLTPSLLFAILESLVGQKLPIPPASNQRGDCTLKVQKVKLFLGVLETDILQEDVGLSGIDPRRLAAGEWPETFFIAKVLCLVGRQLGLLPSTSRACAQSRLGNRRSTESSPARPQSSRPLRKASSVPTTSTQQSSPPSTSRYSTPELDTTSVFYAPSSTTTRDTHNTITSFFGDCFANDTRPTTPDPSYEAKVSHNATDHRDRLLDSIDDAPTPSSVALSFEPPFTSPALSTRPDDGFTSLLLSVDDLPNPHPTSRPKFPTSNGSRSQPRSIAASPPSPASTASSGRRFFYRKRAATSPPPSTFNHNHRGIFNPNASTASAPSEIESDYDFHPQKVPVRYSGYIERVDEDYEIASYEHSRSLDLVSPEESELGSSTGNRSILRELEEEDSRRSRSGGTEDKTTRTIAAIQGEYERTLKLLDERTRLLKELADLKLS